MTRHILFVFVLFPLIGCGKNAAPAQKPSTPEFGSGSARQLPDRTQTERKKPEQRKIVTLTTAAVAKVLESQKGTGMPYLRVAVKSGGSTGYMYDLQFADRLESDDYLDELSGLKIVVDRKSALFIEGATIDWKVTDDGQEGFHFDNPNALKQ